MDPEEWSELKSLAAYYETAMVFLYPSRGWCTD